MPDKAACRSPVNRLAPALAPMLAALLPLALAGCGAAAPVPQDAPAPRVAAENPALAAAADRLFDGSVPGETRALLVLRNGEPVFERYGKGYGPDMPLIGWSMTKSVTAMLAGLMIADGRLALERPAPVPEWRTPGDPRGRITLAHLLHMEAGLAHEEVAREGVPVFDADTPKMLFLDGADDMARYAENRPLEAAPGAAHEYSTATSVIIADVLTDALTASPDPKARRAAMQAYLGGRLLDPLGIGSATAEYDRAGTFSGGSLLYMTARDWAKLGELMRNGGSVRGAQVLPRHWVQWMRTPSLLDPAYGGHVWLNRSRDDGRDAPLFPDRAEPSVFAFIGHLGQYVIVAPERGLTVVRLGQTDDAHRDALVDALAGVVTAVPKR